MFAAQRVVVAANRIGIAFQFADHRARVNVVHARQAHPFRDDTEVDAVRFLPRVGSVARAMQMQNHAVSPCPFRHRLDGRVSDREIDHHDHAAQFFGEIGPFVHLLHGAGGDVQVVAFDLAGGGHSAIHRLHAEQE